MLACHHFGRPGTPTDQAWIESLFGHLKVEQPHLELIEDIEVLRAELAVQREHYNTVRLHAGIGYVTPDQEHRGEGAAVRAARRDGLARAREARLTYHRNHLSQGPIMRVDSCDQSDIKSDTRQVIIADTCADCLLAKRDYLDYPLALHKGWPIATGVIESACRHLVKDRMDLTGARWGLEGAEAVLRPRALRANQDFDDYWRFHLRMEHRRVHESQHKEALPLAA